MAFIINVSGSSNLVKNGRATFHTGAGKGSLLPTRLQPNQVANPLPSTFAQVSGTNLDNKFDNVGYYVGQTGVGY